MKITVTKTYDNWLTLLEALVDGSVILDAAQMSRIQYAAQQWPTCACGEVCSSLPRGERGAPIDSQLFELGCSFNSYIQSAKWTSALYIFKAIEQRTTLLLLSEIKAKVEKAEGKAQAKAVVRPYDDSIF